MLPNPFVPRGISKDFYLEVKRGAVPGHRIRHKFGRNENVGAALVTIGCGQTGILTKKTVAGKFYIASDDANDTLGSIGAESVFIEGVDEDFNQQSEIVDLDGLTAAPTVKDYIGFPVRLKVVPPDGNQYPVFTTRQAAGTLTTYDDAGKTTPYTSICPINGQSNNQSLIAADIIPAGEVAFIFTFWESPSDGKSLDVFYRVQEFGGVIKTQNITDLFQSPIQHKHTLPGLVPEKSLIEFQAISESAGAQVSASIEMLIVKHEFLPNPPYFA